MDYIFDDHDEEGELDAQCLAGILRACNEGSGYISAHNFKDWGLDILVCPFWTMFSNQVLYFSHIWSGLLPILYSIDRNPDW